MRFLKKILFYHKLYSVILLFIAISIFISLITYNNNDPSFNLVTENTPHNMLSYFGSYISDMLFQLIGLSSYIIPLCIIIWSYMIFQKGKISFFFIRVVSLLLAIILFCSGLHLLVIDKRLVNNIGGIVGSLVWYFIDQYYNIKEIHNVSSFVFVCVMLASVFLFFSFGIKFKRYIEIIISIVILICKTILRLGVVKTLYLKVKLLDKGNAYYAEEEFASVGTTQIGHDNDTSIMCSTVQKIQTKYYPLKKKLLKSRVHNRQDKILPSIDLLDTVIKNQDIANQSNKTLEENAQTLLLVLKDFGVKGTISEVYQGPVVTIYEFIPAAGIKLSRIIGLADDISRSLAVMSTRIASIPGKQSVGIEIPNNIRTFFQFRELVESKSFYNANIALPIVLGKNIQGSTIIVDLAKMPHLLISGTTGSGKSVAIHTMIISILYKYTPLECRIMMIDPKMLELSAYNDIPHLITPVITDSSKAVLALKWAVKEMESRYRLMSYLGVRNIENYNIKIQTALKEGQILERKIQTGFHQKTGKPIYEVIPIDREQMPFLIIIVDEVADLMLTAGKDVEQSIQRLSQMARASGIHIIMSTQRPSVDVITGVIKANFPSRISFKVSSKIDSRTILGEQGAEQLLGRGDMLYQSNGSKTLRVHGPFITDEEITRVSNFLRAQGTTDYISKVTEFSADNTLHQTASNKSIKKK